MKYQKQITAMVKTLRRNRRNRKCADAAEKQPRRTIPSEHERIGVLAGLRPAADDPGPAASCWRAPSVALQYCAMANGVLGALSAFERVGVPQASRRLSLGRVEQ